MERDAILSAVSQFFVGALFVAPYGGFFQGSGIAPLYSAVVELLAWL